MLLALPALAACSPRSSPGNAPPEPTPVFDATPPAPRPYAASTRVRATLEEPSTLPATGVWPARILTADELAAVLEPVARADYPRQEEGRRAVAALGTVAFVAATDGRVGGIRPYDPSAGSVLFTGNGFRGLASAIILSFEDEPPITIGSLPGPIGGSVSLSGAGRITLRLATDAATAAELAAAALEQQYLIRAIELRHFDDVPYLRAELLGYRLVDAADHTVYYDSLGQATAPGSGDAPDSP